MSITDWVGLGICVIGWAFVVGVFVGFPDFARAFYDYWRPEAVARRMREWSER